MKTLVGMMVLLVLLLGAASVSAQDDTVVEVMRYEWHPLGLSFDIPADWQSITDERFAFVLLSPTAAGQEQSGSFIGLQTGALPPDETVEAFFQNFAQEQLGVDAEAISIGDSTAYRIQPPGDETGHIAFLGFSSVEGELGLLIIQDATENLEDFDALVDSVISSMEIVPLALDIPAINAELQADLEAGDFMSLGDESLPVKMVEVLDFSCVHCVNYGVSIDRFIQDYVETGQVQFQFNFVTFVGQQASELATHAFYCAVEQGQAWEMHHALLRGYTNSGGPAYYTLPNIMEAAAEMELDSADLESCIAEERYAEQIAADDEYATALGVNSTPSLLFTNSEDSPAFVSNNGQELRGGIPLSFVYSYLDALIEETQAGG